MGNVATAHKARKIKRQNMRSTQKTKLREIPLEQEVQALIEASRDARRYSLEEALGPARDALELAIQIKKKSLQFDAVLNLASRLHSIRRIEERNRLLDEWKGSIAVEGNTDQIAYLANTLAIIQIEHSEFYAALTELKLALGNITVIANRRLRVMLKINAGNCYSGLGINDMAVQWFYDALRDAEELEDDQLLAFIHNNLGVLHRKLLDLTKASKEFGVVIRLAEKTGDRDTLARAYNNLCTVNYFLEEWDKAMAYSRMAHELFIEMGDQSGIQSCLTNTGAVYQQLEEYDRALEHFEEALAIASALDDKHQISNLLMNVGKIRRERGELDSALGLFKKALSIAVEIGALDLQNDLHNAFAELYEKAGDYQRALESFKSLMDVKEDFFLGRQREIIEELRIRYEVEHKEREAAAFEEKCAALEREIESKKAIEEELEIALLKIRVLMELLPVCSKCNRILDETGHWTSLEEYTSKRGEKQPSKTICPDCSADSHAGVL